MMQSYRLLWLLTALILLAACGTDGLYSGMVVTEGNHVIERGRTVEGMVLVVDGQLHLQPETQVTGSIYLLDGVLLVDGAVDADVFLVGGALTLGEEAMVAGDLTQAGGTLALAPGAVVQGQVQRGSDVELTLRPEWSEQSTGRQLLWSLAQALGLAILAAVIVRLVPQPVHRVADAVVEHPVAAAALGILVGIVAPSLLVMMAFTLILIPVTAVGLVLGGAVIAYGLIAWGVVAGRVLERYWRGERSPALTAFLGTLLFMALMEGAGLIPLVGAILPLLLALIGLGAVFLTRFGRQAFVPATEEAVLRNA
jgi:cytoskeletal protein CcmA (bactofilin family)